MTHNFDPHNENLQPAPTDPHNQATGALNTMQRDRFELLSAYLDGEVTAAERKQVEDWLANDATVQRLHARLISLRQALQTMPVPATSSRSVEDTVERVFAQVERRPKLSLIWGGAAIAAVFMGAVGTLFFNEGGLVPQIATQTPVQTESAPPQATNEPLLVALDRPLVNIPKAPVAQPSFSTDGGASIR